MSAKSKTSISSKWSIQSWAHSAKLTTSQTSNSSSFDIESINDADDEIKKNIVGVVTLIGVMVILGSVVGYKVLWPEPELKRDDPILPKGYCRSQVHGDGICDDKQNIPECDYDGLDCCLLTRGMSFCEACECHLGKCTNKFKFSLVSNRDVLVAETYTPTTATETTTTTTTTDSTTELGTSKPRRFGKLVHFVA
jgi:hypothetical protein